MRFLPLLLVLAVLIPATAARAAAPRPTSFTYAPYTDMTDYPAPNFRAFRNAGIKRVSLAFVVARGGNRCRPAWGGLRSAPASGPKPFLRGAIASFRQRGGDVVVSFGGQAGVELASACGTAAKLATAYGAAIAAYHARRVDFDVEGATIESAAGNDRRARAIAILQRAARRRHRPLFVSFTLPTLPSGLDASGLALVRDAERRGVDIGVVDGMAMDWGDEAAPNPSGHMGDYAVKTGRGLYGQLRKLFKGRPAGRVARMVGVTPMLGVNDVASEVFGLDDAAQLAGWAGRRHIGMLGVWSLGRDRACARRRAQAQDHCSGVSQRRWDFSHALGRFRG